MAARDPFYTLLRPLVPGNVPIIWANQDGARPAGLYVTLRFDGIVRRAPAQVGMQDAVGIRAVSAHRSGNLELQAFGTGAYDLLDVLGTQLAHDTALVQAEQLNITIGPMGNVTDEPALRDNHQWEPRAIASLPFAYTASTPEELSWIETVTGTIQVEGATAMPAFASPYTATVVED